MYFLDAISNFCQRGVLNSIIFLLICCFVWPGVYFIVGAIFESRLISLRSGQSRAFFPGGLLLSVALTAIFKLNVDIGEWARQSSWWGLITTVVIIVSTWLYFKDASQYPYPVANSPTKITQGIIGLFIFPTLLIAVGFPKLLASIIIGSFKLDWIVCFAALMFYAACVLYDTIHPANYRQLQLRHPDNWRPLWR